MRWWRGLEPGYRRFAVTVAVATFAAGFVVDALNLTGFEGFFARIIVGAAFVVLLGFLLALFGKPIDADITVGQDPPGEGAGPGADSSPTQDG